jgi:hypothetical protein
LRARLCAASADDANGPYTSARYTNTALYIVNTENMKTCPAEVSIFANKLKGCTYGDANAEANPRHGRDRAPRIDEHADRKRDRSDAREIQPCFRPAVRMLLLVEMLLVEAADEADPGARHLGEEDEADGVGPEVVQGAEHGCDGVVDAVQEAPCGPDPELNAGFSESGEAHALVDIH